MLVGICGPAGSGKTTTAGFLVKNHGFVEVALADPLKRICQDVYGFSDQQLWGPSDFRNAQDVRYPRFQTGDFAVEVSGKEPQLVHRTKEGDWYVAVPGEEEMKPAPKWLTDQLQARDVSPAFLTPRHALQQLGTEWGRHNYDNTWVDYALRIAAKLQAGGCYYDVKTGLHTVSEVDYDRRTGTGGIQARKDVAISDVRFKNEIDAIHASGGKVIRLIRETTLKGAAAAHRSEQEQLTLPAALFDFNIENTGTLHALERMTKMAVNVFLDMDAT
jgi:hypothetical protein